MKTDNLDAYYANLPKPEAAWEELELLLGEFSAVCLIGCRQIGKTTLAHRYVHSLGPNKALYLDLENPEDRRLLDDPALFFRQHADKLVVLDEVQRVPELFPILRGVIDARIRHGKQTGQFLLLGSASHVLLQQTSESLTGRIAWMELTGFAADEQAETEQDKLWLRGSYPRAFLASSDPASGRWREQLIASYLERDIPQLGVNIPAITLRRLWTMQAHEQGGLHNQAKLAAALALHGQTVSRYVDVLVDTLLTRRLQGWASNAGKRLVRAPKFYVRDSGLLHSLLGIKTQQQLLSHPIAGFSYEGWAIEQLISTVRGRAEFYFYRTSNGAEIDLLLDRHNGERWAIEVKRASAPSISRGFYTAIDDVAATRRLLIAPVKTAYTTSHGIEVMTLTQAKRLLRQS